jgi:hypothetical protein
MHFSGGTYLERARISPAVAPILECARFIAALTFEGLQRFIAPLTEATVEARERFRFRKTLAAYSTLSVLRVKLKRFRCKLLSALIHKLAPRLRISAFSAFSAFFAFFA